jgi:RNA polymerase sigma-70 factor (ECF subfamily)
MTREAFEASWAANYRFCCRAAYAMGERGGLEEDAAQNTLILAWLNLPAFRSCSAFSTWLHSILRNVVLGTYRSSYGRNPLESYDDLPEARRAALLRDNRNPEDQYAQMEAEQLIEREIRRMPRPYSEILLASIGPRPAFAVSAQLGITICAAKNRLSRARRDLRKRLAVHC